MAAPSAPVEVVQTVAEMAASGVIGSVAYALLGRARRIVPWIRRTPDRAKVQQLASRAIHETFGEPVPAMAQPTTESFSANEWRLAYEFHGATYTATGKGTKRRSVAVSRTANSGYVAATDPFSPADIHRPGPVTGETKMRCPACANYFTASETLSWCHRCGVGMHVSCASSHQCDGSR